MIVGGDRFSSLKYYESLIKKSDVKVGVDSGTKVFMELNILPDYVVGDLDSIDENTLKWIEENNVKVFIFPKEKDQVDTELAMKLLWDLGIDEIWISGALGGRVDHLLAIILLLGKFSNANPIIKEESIEIGVIENKEKNLKAKIGETWSIIPIGGDAIGVTLRGFKYEITDKIMPRFEPFGISNVAQNDEVYISVKKGTLVYIRYKINVL